MSVPTKAEYDTAVLAWRKDKGIRLDEPIAVEGRVWIAGYARAIVNRREADERIQHALRAAEDAIAGCYEVTSYPANGTSRQDQALAKVRSALQLQLAAEIST